MSWNDDSTRVDVTLLHGSVTFTDDLTDVLSLSSDGVFTIRNWSGIVPHTIEIRSSGGKLTRTYYVAGISRGWDEDARRMLARELPAIVRRSGLGAQQRVKSILAGKGVSGVLDEIALLGGDYARRLYFVALVDTANLDASSIQPVLLAVGQRMTSDYDRGQVLQHIAGHVTLDERAASAYLQAMGSMKSDYERRRALTVLLAKAPAAQNDALFAAVDQMKSSYDKRQVLAEALTKDSLTLEAKKALLVSSAGIQSDYDRSQVLLGYVERFGVEPSVRDAFFTAVRAIKSDYERRRVLTAVANKGSVSADVQQQAFAIVAGMFSDYDRAEVLLAFLHAQGVSAGSRDAFVTAAERIKSSHDQNRVLAALVKSEVKKSLR